MYGSVGTEFGHATLQAALEITVLARNICPMLMQVT